MEILTVNGEQLPLSPAMVAELAAEESKWRSQGRRLVGQIEPRPQTQARGRRQLPETWTVVHVLDRLEEAFEVLLRLPMNTRPRGHGNSMPRYAYDRADLVAQVETGELERMMRVQNRVRLGVTADQIERMDEALAWPMQFLGDMPEVARALQLATMWAARRLDVGKACKALGINKRGFLRQKMHGLNVVTLALRSRQVQVR